MWWAGKCRACVICRSNGSPNAFLLMLLRMHPCASVLCDGRGHGGLPCGGASRRVSSQHRSCFCPRQQPEAGVESLAQVMESAAGRLAVEKGSPSHTSMTLGVHCTARSDSLSRAVTAEPRGDHGKLKKAAELPY